MTLVNKADSILEECLKEMFKRVGEKYPNKKLTDQKEWYTKRTWTEHDQLEYIKWMKKKLKKAFPYLNEKRLVSEVSLFLLMWGWKTIYEEKPC